MYLGRLGAWDTFWIVSALWNGCRPDLLTGQGHPLVKAIHLHGSYTTFDMPVSGFHPLLGDDREAVHGSPLELYIVYRFILALQRLFSIFPLKISNSP